MVELLCELELINTSSISPHVQLITTPLPTPPQSLTLTALQSTWVHPSLNLPIL